MVVQARERKMRFRLVDQEDSMGIARKEPKGRARGARRDVRIVVMVMVGGRLGGVFHVGEARGVWLWFVNSSMDKSSGGEWSVESMPNGNGGCSLADGNCHGHDVRG